MKAYKFRSPSQIEFALDILLNKRLHCAPWSNLKDPLEGLFSCSRRSDDSTDYSRYLDNIKIQKQQLRICSLSKSFDIHLCWAHYAAGFTGMAIDVELADGDRDIADVRYRECVFEQTDVTDLDIPADTTRRILTSKYNKWQYEQELRILSAEQWFSVRKINRLIIGHRMSSALAKALRIVCESKRIPVCRTGKGDEGIDADPLPSLSRRREFIPR